VPILDWGKLGCATDYPLEFILLVLGDKVASHKIPYVLLLLCVMVVCALPSLMLKTSMIEFQWVWHILQSLICKCVVLSCVVFQPDSKKKNSATSVEDLTSAATSEWERLGVVGL